MNAPPILERIFGPSWRTTATGIAKAMTSTLTMLAALPYTLGDVATIIPPEWKANVVIIGLIASKVLEIAQSFNMKDRQVSGTPGTGVTVSPAGQAPRQIEPQTPDTEAGKTD